MSQHYDCWVTYRYKDNFLLIKMFTIVCLLHVVRQYLCFLLFSRAVVRKERAVRALPHEASRAAAGVCMWLHHPHQLPDTLCDWCARKSQGKAFQLLVNCVLLNRNSGANLTI